MYRIKSEKNKRNRKKNKKVDLRLKAPFSFRVHSNSSDLIFIDQSIKSVKK